jgi:hypothetical protein
MEFTAQETKLIERLRKQDRQWKWARWLLLAMGFFSATVCAVFSYAVHWVLSESARGQLDSSAVLLLLLFWTKGCLYFVFSIWCFVTAAIKWHGDVNRMLLLRLLDSQTVK